MEDAVKARSGNDHARLHEAMVYAAYLVERYGDAYAPVFERLADEWEAIQRNDGPAARARRILAAHTFDGGMKAIR
jgi:hypothetical protein